MTARALRHEGGLDLRLLLTPRWVLATLLVIAAVAVMVRLGIWQLERLEQRRVVNAQVASMATLPALDLNQAWDTADLTVMDGRAATVTGVYVPEEEVLLRNQAWNDLPGYHVLTPLRIEGSEAVVLVNRGWIPLEEGGQSLDKYAEPGTVTVSGWIEASQVEPRRGGRPDPELAPGQTRLEAWNFVNLERIALQVSGELLPVYLLAAPGEGTALLQRSAPEVDLSEGPHMGYAVQWFLFASMLGVGYPFYVRNQLKRNSTAH